MRFSRLTIFLTAGICLLSLFADSPRFVTKRMLDRRNGLTDEQFEYLWSIGRNPSIPRNTARDWVFRAGRYQNVTNWLEICGKTNDFAKLSYSLQDENFILSDTNKLLVATNNVLERSCARLAEIAKREYDALTNSLAKCTALSNTLVIVSAQADAANAKINDEIADLEAKITKYEEYKTKYPLLKAIFAAMITDAENRIKILQALTGAN